MLLWFSPRKKKKINLESSTSTIQNEKYQNDLSKDSRNLKISTSISKNLPKVYSTISTGVPQGSFQSQGNYYEKYYETNQKIRKYIKNVTKKSNITIDEIYAAFQNKIDYIIDECEKKRTVSESEDSDSQN
jgi:hypothetical protein